MQRLAPTGRHRQRDLVSAVVQREQQGPNVDFRLDRPESRDDGACAWRAIGKHVCGKRPSRSGIASRAPRHCFGAQAPLLLGQIGGQVRNRHGRWRDILPEPAFAGGRQIPRPGPRQSQLPEECLLAPGMNCLTHPAVPPSLIREPPARLQSLPPAWQAGSAAAPASDRRPPAPPASRPWLPHPPVSAPL